MYFLITLVTLSLMPLTFFYTSLKIFLISLIIVTMTILLSIWFVVWFGIIILIKKFYERFKKYDFVCLLLRWLLVGSLFLRWPLLRCCKLYKLLNKNIIFITYRWLLFRRLLQILSLSKISPSGEIGCLENPYFLLTGCLGIPA